jgi:hypothetical protein
MRCRAYQARWPGSDGNRHEKSGATIGHPLLIIRLGADACLEKIVPSYDDESMNPRRKYLAFDIESVPEVSGLAQ